jgi:hypothetical protein
MHIGRAASHTGPARWQSVLRPRTVSDRRIRRALLHDVKDAKESLSRHAQTDVPMPEPFGDVRVTRTELEALVRPSFLRSGELLAATIRAAGLTPVQLGGIYLVGVGQAAVGEHEEAPSVTRTTAQSNVPAPRSYTASGPVDHEERETA